VMHTFNIPTLHGLVLKNILPLFLDTTSWMLLVEVFLKQHNFDNNNNNNNNHNKWLNCYVLSTYSDQFFFPSKRIPVKRNMKGK
ncbi:MAG: hypothetical protein N7Q72_01760, partial [Spiroplasma sp. Tabriz.8]|nr:hypothetical protein [Spiroplasma sp. Tabriz.8]